MLRSAWKGSQSTNKEVLSQGGTERSLLETEKHRKLSFFDHLLAHISLQRNLPEGMMGGKRKKWIYSSYSPMMKS